MRADILKSAGIDYDGGVKRFMGRAALYEKVLAKFPKDLTFSRIKNDMCSGDTEKLLMDTHELKGMCGNISLPDLFSAAEDMVNLLRRGEYEQSDLDASFARLEANYIKVYEAVLSAMEDEQ